MKALPIICFGKEATVVTELSGLDLKHVLQGKLSYIGHHLSMKVATSAGWPAMHIRFKSL